MENNNHNSKITYQNSGKNIVMPKKASLESRVTAFIIDVIIISLIITIPTFFLFFYIGRYVYDLMMMMFLFLLFAPPFLYSLKDVINGQSIGKRFAKIAVRDNADISQKPSLAKLFMRNIFILIWPLDVLVFVCSKQKKRIGDRLSNTDVYCIKN